jgi:hypothetical protein
MSYRQVSQKPTKYTVPSQSSCTLIIQRKVASLMPYIRSQYCLKTEIVKSVSKQQLVFLSLFSVEKFLSPKCPPTEIVKSVSKQQLICIPSFFFVIHRDVVGYIFSSEKKILYFSSLSQFI